MMPMGPEMMMPPPPQQMPPQLPPEQSGGLNPILMMLIQLLSGGGQQGAPMGGPMEMSAPMSNFPIEDPTANVPNYQDLAKSYLRGRNI